jgi:two-component system CheB/CheR fusion protein
MRCRLVALVNGRLGLWGVVSDETRQILRGHETWTFQRELQHRVKSVLAVVRSLAARTAETAPSMDDFTAHFEGRLAAVSRMHSLYLLTPTRVFDFEAIIRDEFLQHGVSDAEQLQAEGEPVELPQRAAELMCLAIHELATNALKFGALASADGRVCAKWSVHERAAGREIFFEWREEGVRLMDATPGRTGFGRDLIERGLPYELDARTRISFQPGGLECRIELPLTDYPSSERRP